MDLYNFASLLLFSSSVSNGSNLPRNEMSEQRQKVVPAQLGFLAIYNPSLGITDEELENQIVYYYPSPKQNGQKRKTSLQTEEERATVKEQKNEQLRQIGLAQGMVEFGRSFADGKSVDTVETEKSRIILHELESGWWILAVSINIACRAVMLTETVRQSHDIAQYD